MAAAASCHGYGSADSEDCLILALDVGTSCCKAALLDCNGRARASVQVPYSHGARSSADGCVEQGPEEWWEASVAATQSLKTQLVGQCLVKAVALTGMMQCLTLIDKDGLPLRASLQYNDSRAKVEASQLEERGGGASVLSERLGNWKGALSIPPKLLWLQRNEPEVLGQATSLLLGAHSFVALRLCGALVTDGVTASTTGLLSSEDGMYCSSFLKDLLPECRLDWKAVLPAIVPADQSVGGISEAVALKLGFPELAGAKVFHGCGDAGSATCGVGAGLPGVPYAYMGTSGWVAVTAARGFVSGGRPGLFTLEHPSDRSFVIAAAPTTTAGGCLDWMRRICCEDGRGGGDSTFEAEEGYAQVCREAAESEPGSRSLLFMPWLAGERSPFLDSNARGGFVGLSLLTTRADMCRAVLEGVAYSYRALLDAVLPGHAEHEGASIIVAGGPSKSSIWMQTMADVLQVRVEVAGEAQHAGARGAALLAAKGLGWVDSIAPKGFFPPAEVYVPDRELAEFHYAQYQIHARLHASLHQVFQDLAAVPRLKRRSAPEVPEVES